MTESERYKALLPDAKVIRDEVGDSKNTAYRVGKLFFDVISAVLAGDNDINNKIDNSINDIREFITDAKISSSEIQSYSDEIRIKLNDATGAHVVEFVLPVATNSSAGIISANDKAILSDVSTYGHHGLFSGNLDNLNNLIDIGTYTLLAAKATGIPSINGYLIIASGASSGCLYQFIYTDYRIENDGQIVGAFGRENIFCRCYYIKDHGGVASGTWTTWKNFTEGLFSSVVTESDKNRITLSFRDDNGKVVQSANLMPASDSSAGLISSTYKKKLDALNINHSVFIVSGTPYAQSYPNIDTKKGILDLGEDPILIVDGVEWAFKGIVDESVYRNITITPEQGSSSALILLFSNKNPRTFKFVTFISDELDDGVIVGTVRRSTFTGEVFNADFPFTVMMDGKLQGVPEYTVGSGDVCKPANTNGIKSVTVDLDNDSEEEIWDKISTNTALVYFVYKGDKIYSALVSAGKSSYSIMYMTEDGMRSTRIRMVESSGEVSYLRDDYYTELVD